MIILKHCFIVVLVIIFFACSNKTNQNQLAIANKVDGVYIFIKSKPSSPYDFLGSIDLNWYDKLTQLDQQNFQSVIHNISGIINFSDNLENTINQARQKYPTFEGLVFDDNMNKCEVIKFRN